MNINLSKWMERISDDRNLLSLDIPGAHDCAANFIQMPRLSRCQNTDIYGLLSLGIRALDIRVDLSDNKLVLVHAIHKIFVSGEKGSRRLEMSDVIKQIKRFLNENPTETVVFQFKNDSEKKMEDCFDVFWNSHISKEKNLWYTENRIPQIGEIRGKIVLLRRCEMYKNNKPYNSKNAGVDFSLWDDQKAVVPEAEELPTNSDNGDIFIIQDRYNYAPKQRWSKCLKPFLDERKPFDKKYIICYTSTAGGLGGPKKNSDYINPKFLEYSLNKDNYYGILYFDFPSKEITKKVIENNLMF